MTNQTILGTFLFLSVFGSCAIADYFLFTDAAPEFFGVITLFGLIGGVLLVDDIK